ncbi:MAG TPA: protein kinase [Kofleriaceae bacterium]
MTADLRFGRYRVTAPLGAGAMGEVFAAIDDVLGREVAVKTLRGSASGLAARLRDDRFRQEARAIAALHHPGVVAVFDLDLTANPPYLVMERVAGPSLKERLAHGPLPGGELRALGIQVARAIAAAHAAGILHRDVKPANILAAGPGTWKLADFGVAHVPDSSITMTGQFVGSPAYAPPEALIRGLSGAAGDIFGLGATLYEAAAGRWPRMEAGGTVGGLLLPLPPVTELVPGLPAELAAAIDRAVAIEPEHRPTADELAEALAGAASQITPVPQMSPVPSQPVTLVPRATATEVVASPRRDWKPWVAAAVIALALIFALARGGSSTSPVAPELAPAVAATPADAPTTAPITAPVTAPSTAPITAPPPGLDGKQTKDWRKIFDQLDKGHVDEARHKLDELEHKYGATDDTRRLRAQLDATPPSGPPGPPGPGHDPPGPPDDDDDPPRPGPPHPGPDPRGYGHHHRHGD